MQLIVLGMHRSGSSVLARMLNLMGAYFAPEGVGTGANRENQKGFWERRDVRSLNDYVLHAVGCDWNRVSRFDVDNLPVKVVAEFIKNASKLVLEMDAHRPWMLKEPRLCLLLPLWLRVLEIPICVQILRNPVEVASSLRVRNGIPIKVGMVLWEKYVRSALAASSHLPRILVLHHQMMLEPEDAVKRLYADLLSMGIESLRMPTEREIGAFVDQGLYRERDSRSDLSAYSSASQVGLFKNLVNRGTGKSRISGTLTAANHRVLSRYESSLHPMQPGSTEYSGAGLDSKPLASIKTLELKAKTTMDIVEKLDAEIKRGDQERGLLESNLSVLRARITALESQIEQNRKAMLDTQGKWHATQEAVTQLTSTLKSSEDARAEGERNLKERFREIAQLTRMLMDKNNELVRVESETKKLRAKLDESRGVEAVTEAVMKKLKQQNQRLDARVIAESDRAAGLERRITEITNSKLWKLTTPARLLGQATRHKRQVSRSLKQDQLVIYNSGLFDSEWYLQRYPDVATSGMDPVEHYLRFGATEGRNPSVTFNTRFYLQANVDVAGFGVNPLLHFIRHGMAEGRLTQPKR